MATAEYATIADLEDTERKLRASLAGLEGGLSQVQGWRKQMESDDAFGRVFSGPQWLGGASIIDGTVGGNIFKANVTISSVFKTAESPADRWELDTAGLRFYSTVATVQNTKVFDVNPGAGTLQLGTSGANAITFTGGVLSIPAAAIASLTIANVGDGVIGGTYSSGAANPKMQISTAGIKAYNGSGVATFDLQAASGNFNMIGTFQIASSASASNRLSMTQAGVELWKGGVREFFLDSSGGSSGTIQMLLTGPSAGQYIGMEPSAGKGLWLGASTFASAPFSVDLAGTATMVGATIKSAASGARVELTGSGLIAYNSGGSQTINIAGASSTITAGLVRTAASGARVEMDSTGLYVYDATTVRAQLLATGAGSLGMGTSTAITWTSAGATQIDPSAFKAGNLGATITIASGGKIIDADGSYWDQSGIVLASSGTFGDAITWKVSGTSKGSIYADANNFYMYSQSWGGIYFNSSGVHIYDGSTTGGLLLSSTGVQVDGSGSASSKFNTSGDLSLYRRLYPGNSGQQSTGYLAWDGTNVQIAGADVYIVNYLKAAQTGTASATPGNCTHYVAIKDSGGNTRYLPTYTSTAFSD